MLLVTTFKEKVIELSKRIGLEQQIEELSKPCSKTATIESALNCIFIKSKKK
jgi:hypothetical protein